MYTVLIAEDELLVRMGLTVSVPWEALDMMVVAEVSDGQQALAAWRQHRPDILITDLMMPGMDGLTLIRHIAEEDPHCAVIVVTCMEQFELLHEAMELGVAAYLVKATMTTDDIQHAVEKAKARLGAPRGGGGSQPDPQMQVALSQHLLEGSVSWPALLSMAKAHGWALPEACAPLLVRPPAGQPLPWQLQKTLRSSLREYLEREPVACILQGPDATVLVLAEGYADAMDVERRCQVYCQFFEAHFGLSLTIDACARPIPLDGLAAMLAAMAPCEAGRPTGRYIRWVDEAGSPEDPVLAQWVHSLCGRIWMSHRAHWSAIAAREADKLGAAALRSTAAFARALRALAALYQGQGMLPPDAMAAFCEYLEGGPGVLPMILRFEEDIAARAKPYRPEIRKVIAYALEHLDGQLTLGRMAKLIYMHPQYLSNLFRKETGASISEFLSMLRVERACQLLAHSALSVQQVAVACGFSDAAYFCRLFKRRTGKTPSQWRRIQCA